MAINKIDNLIITDISWERIFLSFTLEGEKYEDAQFYLVRSSEVVVNEEAYYKKIETPIYALEEYERVLISDVAETESGYVLTVDIACIDDGRFLNNGTWTIKLVNEENDACLSMNMELAKRLDEKTRIFPYGNNPYGPKKYSYNVFFDMLSFVDDGFIPVVNSFFMKRNDKWMIRKHHEEANHKKDRMRLIKKAVVVKLIRMYYFVVSRITPKNGKRVLFMTETKPFLWGNLLYIHNRMIERGLDKDFKITVSCRSSVGSHKGVMSWVKAVTKIAQNDIIFVDDYAPVFGFFKLNPKTKLVQVWHAGEGFKSVGYSRFGKNGSPFPSESPHKAYTHALVGSQRLIHVYEEVFGIPADRFLTYGMPRLDGFLEPETIAKTRAKVYAEYPMLEGKKVILFAPTFRGTVQEDAVYDYDQLDFDRIYDFCGDEYIFAVKMHPFIKEPAPIRESQKDRIIDLTKYQNINDLYYVTEIMITDYSSAFYEFALMKKPVLFFTYDRENYELVRGVHRKVKENAPGRVCDSFEELMDALETGNYEFEKTAQFIEENFGDYDGCASDKVIDHILLNK